VFGSNDEVVTAVVLVVAGLVLERVGAVLRLVGVCGWAAGPPHAARSPAKANATRAGAGHRLLRIVESRRASPPSPNRNGTL